MEKQISLRIYQGYEMTAYKRAKRCIATILEDVYYENNYKMDEPTIKEKVLLLYETSQDEKASKTFAELFGGNLTIGDCEKLVTEFKKIYEIA